jgi:hypothetical protein
MRKAGPDAHILKMDVRKFYYRVDHGILECLLAKKIKDKRLLSLMMTFAKDGESNIGLPIGNLLSQLYALVYLNALDHYAKREIKLPHYARYVDDFVMVLPTKGKAYEVQIDIEGWLGQNLNLGLSKWSVTPIKRGVDFVGFRTWRNRRFVRRRSIHKFSRSMRAGNIPSLTSIVGNSYGTSTLGYFVRRLREERPDLVLPKKMRARHANVFLRQENNKRTKRHNA